VTVPAGTGGSVSIAETTISEPPPSGYSLLGQQVNITAPAATAASPLELTFLLSDTSLPEGVNFLNVEVLRNEGSGPVAIPECMPGATGASPDPCVHSREALDIGGGARLIVLTSHASTWNFALLKASQAINFKSTPPSAALFGGTYTPSATGGASGNPMTFSIDSSSGSGVCSISAGTVSFTGVGTCVVDANQAGNARYLAAPQVQQSFSIAKATQAVTFKSTPPSPALFGGTYTPSATGGASGNPVTLSIDSSNAAGACWILNGKVSFNGPGSCVVDANQAGNANYSAAPQKQQTFSIGFSKTLSGTISGSLTVSSGQAVYLSPGTSIAGSVTVQAGGALFAQGAKIGNSISASGATAIRLCASSLGGSVSITKTTGLVVAGDNDGAVVCAGNKVGGSASIKGNYGGVEFDANSVGGSLAITGNTGTLPPPDSGIVDAVGNKVGGAVQIQS
jgi:hypothetical protein